MEPIDFSILKALGGAAGGTGITSLIAYYAIKNALIDLRELRKEAQQFKQDFAEMAVYVKKIPDLEKQLQKHGEKFAFYEGLYERSAKPGKTH